MASQKDGELELLPRSETERRLKRLRRWMTMESADAVFILQNADLYYFAGTIQSGILCLPIEEEPVYLVNKSLARARMESPWARIRPLGSLKKAPESLAAEGIPVLRRVGLELDVLPAGFYLKLCAAFPGVDFIDASDAIRKTRMVKSELEIRQLQRAAEMLGEVFEQIPGWMEIGVREVELAARIEGFLRGRGHQGMARMRGFNLEMAYGTVSSGPSACYPTSFPGPVGFVGLYPAIPNPGGQRRLAVGEPLMVDLVGGYGGYLIDQTRMFVLGELPPDLRAAHRFVLDLLRELESCLAPGTLCSSLWNRAFEMIEESPYADNFMGSGDSRVRFVGHGVGLELDELPVLAQEVEIPLEAGMTLAVEPKLFFPGRGGVGVENTYVITRSGHEKLTLSEEDVRTKPAAIAADPA